MEEDPMSLPGTLLRLEGIGVLAGAVVAFGWLDESWWIFVVLLLVPDLGLVGYAFGPRTGAIAYDLTHTSIGPIALAVVAVATDDTFLGALAATWLAHIGMDRALGFGLKYPTAFKDTHLQRV